LSKGRSSEDLRLRIAPFPVGGESNDCLDHISDADLLAGTRRLVGRQNQVLAELVAHLAEVEARGIHRVRACPSLYAYCVYELRMSEDAAFRRARVARLARQFPIIFQQVADGELHLTALVLLAPHLTEENHQDLLSLAKHRTKREVLRIVRRLAPEPSVPDRIEPLGPEPVGIPIPGSPTWRNLVESLAAGVRELPPGARPKDWVDRAGATQDGESGKPPASLAPADAEFAALDSETDERYKISFTASQEYVDLLERAQDLLSHAVPGRALEEVHVRALRLLVADLEKRKYGAPRRKAPADRSEQECASDDAPAAARTTSEVTQTVEPSAETAPRSADSPAVPSKHAPTRRRGTAAVRREVRDRDEGQCTYVDERGVRCRETRFLERHHLHAHARGGGETAQNLTLRCAAHNALAAEDDFGREFMRERSRRRQR